MWEVSTGKAVTLAPFERHLQTAFSLHPHSVAEEVCIVTWGVQAESCLQVTFKASQCHRLTGLLVCEQRLSLRLLGFQPTNMRHHPTDGIMVFV